MQKIAAISAILEKPELAQQEFNAIVSSFKGIVRGRLGIPFEAENIAIISLVVVGDLNDINSLTGKIGNLPHVYVKTAISKKEI